MKFLKDKQTRHDFVTYAMCVVAFAIVFFMQSNHMIPRMIAGQLVPITAYIVMAISLNLVVGIAGDLSLGHAGFMSVGLFTGCLLSIQLAQSVPIGVRMPLSMLLGGVAAHFEALLREALEAEGRRVETIVESPAEGLLKYHYGR